MSGGYAIELAVGRSYREHADVDITVLRRDQQVMRALLADWDVHAADPPGTLRPWPVGEVLPDHVHDIWVREHPGGPWRFQVMLDEADGEKWVYRRDPRIRRPLSTLTITDNGIARIAPEVQLLFKAKSPRPKDELDFTERCPCSMAYDVAGWMRPSRSSTEIIRGVRGCGTDPDVLTDRPPRTR